MAIVNETVLSDIDQEIAAHNDRERLQRYHAEVAVSDLKWLMSDKRGRRVVARLLAQSGMDTNPFTGNSSTFYLSGRLSVALDLKLEIEKHCFDQYITMLKESKE